MQLLQNGTNLYHTKRKYIQYSVHEILSIKLLCFVFFFFILVLLLLLQFFDSLITKRLHLLWIDIVTQFLSIISASSSLFAYDSLCKKESHLSGSVLIFPVSIFCTASPSQIKSCTLWFSQLFQLSVKEYTVLSCMSGLV